MWNVEMDRPSYSSRDFFEKHSAVSNEMTTLCEADQHEDRAFMSHMLNDVNRFNFSGVFHRISTIIATTWSWGSSWGYFSVTAVKNLKASLDLDRPAGPWLMLKYHLFNSLISRGQIIAMEYSWISHFLIFLAVVSHWEVMKDMKLISFLSALFLKIRTGFDLWSDAEF